MRCLSFDVTVEREIAGAVGMAGTVVIESRSYGINFKAGTDTDPDRVTRVSRAHRRAVEFSPDPLLRTKQKCRP